ncbi:hypothetical protein [Pseudoxanthobacter sp.]|uniref:hypothetical protein n=1 Tax=Pseudoxanthobacter sp. TaxID=1925742 RepID=UPI002FE20B6E
MNTRIEAIALNDEALQAVNGGGRGSSAARFQLPGSGPLGSFSYNSGNTSLQGTYNGMGVTSLSFHSESK